MALAANVEEWNLSTDDDRIERSIRAFCTRERRAGNVVQQPSYSDSYTVNPMRAYLHGGERFSGDDHNYVVLRNINGVLAVYRVKDDGHIEFVQPDYWPAEAIED